MAGAVTVTGTDLAAVMTETGSGTVTASIGPSAAAMTGTGCAASQVHPTDQAKLGIRLRSGVIHGRHGTAARGLGTAVRSGDAASRTRSSESHHPGSPELGVRCGASDHPDSSERHCPVPVTGPAALTRRPNLSRAAAAPVRPDTPLPAPCKQTQWLPETGPV